VNSRKGYVSTGAIGHVNVAMPRHKRGKGRTVEPIDLAYYAGETAEDALAFAAVVNASHSAMVEREKVRFAQPVKRPAILTIQHYAGSATVDPRGYRGIDELAAKFSAARKGDRSYREAVAASPRVLVVAIDGVCSTCGAHADAHDARGSGPAPVLYCPKATTPSPKAPKVARKVRTVKAAVPAMAPAIVARDGGKLAPCERCGRSDFRTAGGRDWHRANNPDCSKYRKPERHAYA
jgi:hypothetical protein